MIGDDLLSRFDHAKRRVIGEDTVKTGIGQLSEKTMHRILKLYIEPDDKKHEQKYLGSVADVINSDGIYEIQTRSIEKLLRKLTKYLTESKVTVVLPIISEKRLRWLDKERGEFSESRKSSKHENEYTAVADLYKIRSVLSDKNLAVKLIILKAEEYKYLDGLDKTGKKGATKIECIPTELLGEIDLKESGDYKKFIPDALGDVFTSKDFAVATKIQKQDASCVVGALAAVGAIEFVRKEGRSYVWRRT